MIVCICIDRYKISFLELFIVDLFPKQRRPVDRNARFSSKSVANPNSKEYKHSLMSRGIRSWV